MSTVDLLQALTTAKCLRKAFLQNLDMAGWDEARCAMELLIALPHLESFGILPVNELREEHWSLLSSRQSMFPSVHELSIKFGEPSGEQVSTLLDPIVVVFPKLTTLRIHALEFTSDWNVRFVQFVRKYTMSRPGVLSQIHFSTFFNCLGPEDDRFVERLHMLSRDMKTLFPLVDLVFHHSDSREVDGGLWGASYWVPRDLRSGSAGLDDRP